MSRPGQAAGGILIVDDDEHFRASLALLLQTVGYDTCEAGGAHAALATVRSQRPALVLLDVNLPGLSGYEVCRQLRDEFGERLPIAFVSGVRTESFDRTAGLLLGADDYFVKPFSPDELLARVRRLVVRGNGAPPVTQFELTERELEVLRLLAAGRRQAQIAAELFITSKTVATHIQHILAKLGVHSRAEAVAAAHRAGIVDGHGSVA